MEANSTEDATFPPLKIYLSSSLPGSSLPIRAPLTIDSDSESCLSNNDHIYTRTNSFNSTSSIDISSYGDEHTSVHAEEDNTFLAYPDEEIFIASCSVEEFSFTRPFVKYPDGNYVKERSNFDKSAIFRSGVKNPCEESSSVYDFGIKLGAPVARLTGDCDSDSDIDSVEGRRWLNSGKFLADGINVSDIANSPSSIDISSYGDEHTSAPKVRIFSGDEWEYEADEESQSEGVVYGDGINDIHELNSAMKDSLSTESIEDEEHIDCLNEQSKGDDIDKSLTETDVLSDSDNGTEIETITVYKNESKKSLPEKEEETLEKLQPITPKFLQGTQKHCISAELVEDEEHKVDWLNEQSKGDDIDQSLTETDVLSDSDNDTETEINSDHRNESKKSLPEKEEETPAKLQPITAKFLQGTQKCCISAESIEDEEHKVDCLNEQSKGDDIDKSLTETDVVSDSDNGTKTETISDHRNKSKKSLPEKEEETPTKLQPITPKFLNLVHLLGLSNQDSTVFQSLHRLALGNDKFDFSLTILAIGKTGVGKTATINSIFSENKAMTHPFGSGTTTVQEIVGKVNGGHLRIIDSPGLKCSPSDHTYNLRILSKIKRFIQKHTPDVVLYVDRLDMYTRDNNDSYMLSLIASSLGSSVWQNCIIALTHAASHDLEPLGGFVLSRYRFIQEQIVRFGGSDWRMGNPVWLVENHPGYKQDTGWRNRLILDEKCDSVTRFEWLRESRNVEKRIKKAYFEGCGYRVKILGKNHRFYL